METSERTLEFRVLNTPSRKEFKPVFDLYDRIFTNPDEKTNYQNSMFVLRLNKDKEFLDDFGVFEDTWIYAVTASGSVVGGVNFDTFVAGEDDKELRRVGVGGTASINYLFVDPEHRRKNIGKRLLNSAENYSRNFVAGKKGKESLEGKEKSNVLFFCEIKDPRLMTIDEYLKETDKSEENIFDRLQWWTNRGYARLDFPYIQPPVNPETKPCEHLSLFVKPEFSAAPNCGFVTVCDDKLIRIQSSVVANHLYRFFATFYGDAPEEVGYIKDSHLKQKAWLEQHPETAVVREDYLPLRSDIEGLLQLDRSEPGMERKIGEMLAPSR